MKKKSYTDELLENYSPLLVMEEASRCLLCHDAPCSKSCPAGTDPAKFIRSVRFKNIKGAAETVRENNALGSICARVCPTERYCQEACSRCGIDRPIEIGRIQRFITDFEEATKMEILKKGEPNGKKVAIVGSGPAGLQAATSLTRIGYQVDIFEKKAKAGGYLRYGIPEYRLPSKVIDTDINRIKKLGVNIHLNNEIGKDIKLEYLEKNYDAVILDVGAGEGKMLDLFKGSPYVETAVSFLARTKDSGGKVEVKDNVLVIGGGDVAMDTVTTLKLLGARNVTDVVYEEFSEFKASKKELEGAQLENVTIIDGYIPTGINGKKVSFKHRFIPATLEIESEQIILAVGQVAVPQLGLTYNRNEVDFEGVHIKGTNVFVTGDIAHGEKTVVWNVRLGKEISYYVDQYIGGSK